MFSYNYSSDHHPDCSLLLSFAKSFVFLCYFVCTTSAMDLRERFLLSRIFYLKLLHRIWDMHCHNLLSWKLSWLFFHKVSRVFYKGLKHIPSPFVCLNHRVFRKYMISKELYLNLSKVVDKLLVAKGLRGKLKETQIDSSVLF